MKTRAPLCLLLFGLALPVAAQSAGEVDLDLGRPIAPGPRGDATATGELMKKGLHILQSLIDVLGGVSDKGTADRAALQIYKISAEYQNWGQQVSMRPPLGDEEREAMEATYLPEFKVKNERLDALGQKLAAANYYLSRELYQALELLVQNTQ